MIEVAMKDFAAAVRMAQAAKERRNVIPILDGLKVRANGRFELHATDLDMTAKVSVPCKAKRSAEFMLGDPAAVLSAVLTAGGDAVSFDTFDGGIEVHAGRLHRIAKNQPAADDFPSDAGIAIADQAFKATLSVEALRQIRRVSAAISTEETRYYLNGISMKHMGGWDYRFAATDGHRLMVVDVALPDAEGALPREIILPRRFLSAIFIHLNKADGPLAMSVGTGMFVNKEESTAPRSALCPRVSLSGAVGNAEVQFASKTIDGTYPDYSRIIPQDNPVQMIVAVPELRRAIQSVGAGYPAKLHRSPIIGLKFHGDDLIVSLACNVEGVTAEYSVPCQHNAPADFIVGFRGQYLLDCLNALKGDDAQFTFANSSDPATIRSLGDPDFLSVLMPMRI